MSPEATQSLRNAFRAARNFAEHPEGWLVLLGRTGCGKTHLAASIGHHLEAQGNGGGVLSWCPTCWRCCAPPSARTPAPAASTRCSRRCARRSFLVLDDLGVHSATPWAQEKLFQILNHRYNAKLPTVVTVGCALDDLPEAWVSRMYDTKVSMIFEIEAPDYRGRPRKQAPPAQAPRRGGRGGPQGRRAP